MARQFVAIAIILFAIVGFASAATSSPAVAPAADPSNNVIGNTDPVSGSDAGDDVVAGPVGGPVPDGVFPPTLDTTGAPAPSPKSGSAIVKVSSVVAVTAAAIAIVFI